jgi:hypothetical protein
VLLKSSAIWKVVVIGLIDLVHAIFALLGCYMVKSHGLLVLVSFTHYCASTPSLSTL